MPQIYQETRRRFFDHPAVRIEGAAARAARNCRTPQALTPGLQIVLTLRGAFVYELGRSHSLLTANDALFIAAGDVSRDRRARETRPRNTHHRCICTPAARGICALEPVHARAPAG